MSSRTLVALLAATTIVAGGAAFAADQAATTPPPGHGAVAKDFGKLSADGVRAYQDLTLARLAIFDGRVKDAKTFVDEASQRFDKAKTDESVFTQAEATMRTNTMKTGTSGTSASEQNGASKSAEASSQGTSSGSEASGTQTDVNKPIAWLPVDGTVSINEDYTMQPAKVKAVSEANQSLAKGDRKGAMDKLKLAEVNTAVTLAVVPLEQTISDVDQAKQLIDSGKYYEGSQKLRAVQDATVITVADMPAVPAGTKAADGGANQAKPAAATH